MRLEVGALEVRFFTAHKYTVVSFDPTVGGAGSGRLEEGGVSAESRDGGGAGIGCAAFHERGMVMEGAVEGEAVKVEGTGGDTRQ